MRVRAFVLALAVLVGIIARDAAPATAVQVPPPDPVDVVEDLTLALNSHNVDAVLKLLADGAMVQSDDAPQTRDQIRGWVEQLVREDIHIELEGLPRLARDSLSPRTRTVVNWPATLSMQRYRDLGFNRVKGTVGAIVSGGKITYLRIWPNPDWQSGRE